MCWPKYELKNHSMVSARVLLSMAHGLVVRSTEDIVKLCAEFCPSEHFFSVPKCDLFEIYDPESLESER